MHYKKYKVISSLFAEATPIEGLTIKSQFSADYSHSTGFGISYPEYYPNLGIGTAARNTSDGLTLSVTNTVNYRFRVHEDHSFNFLVGQEGIDYHYESFGVTTQGQNNDKADQHHDRNPRHDVGGRAGRRLRLPLLLRPRRIQLRGPLLRRLLARADASSRFGASNRWGVFWSAGFMWNMRNERFLENAREWLTNAQITISTGTSGNSSIPNYEHLALVKGGLEYVGTAGIAPYTQGNEELSWETTWTTNLGLHFGFWNRLTADLEFYHKKTSDMLMSVPQSYTNGGFWIPLGQHRRDGEPRRRA